MYCSRETSTLCQNEFSSPFQQPWITLIEHMKSKIFALLFVLALAGCGQSSQQPTVVHAGPPAPAPTPLPTSGPSPQLWNWPSCNTGDAEAFALGDVRADGSVIEEDADMLEFAAPVSFSLCVKTIKYTLKFDHSVQGVDIQMGSGKDAIEEWAVWVDFNTPDGHHYRLNQQFDKHTDFRGNQVRFYPVSWTLPAGTVITIRRPAVICVSDPSGENCPTGEKVTLVGK
jgi:uncharacterized lipoprotein YehR (DUF1307 family)